MSAARNNREIEESCCGCVVVGGCSGGSQSRPVIAGGGPGDEQPLGSLQRSGLSYQSRRSRLLADQRQVACASCRIHNCGRSRR